MDRRILVFHVGDFLGRIGEVGLAAGLARLAAPGCWDEKGTLVLSNAGIGIEVFVSDIEDEMKAGFFEDLEGFQKGEGVFAALGL